KYLEKLSEKLCHNCIFLGKPGGWVSYFGVWYAISNQELNLRSLGRDRRLQETRNCEEAVKIMFENYGLVISSESLNDHYKKIQKFKNLTELVMAEMFNKSDEKFMIPDLTDFFYYHPNMNKNLLNALYELDDS
ncbi:hypothetical protein, partial [Acinetobacter ursingii]|uniref:hypothetical protein n=1 Tax=Acinetobacter ursingii TaxID=108980 RepID=UPI00148F3C28